MVDTRPTRLGRLAWACLVTLEASLAYGGEHTAIPASLAVAVPAPGDTFCGSLSVEATAAPEVDCQRVTAQVGSGKTPYAQAWASGHELYAAVNVPAPPGRTRLVVRAGALETTIPIVHTCVSEQVLEAPADGETLIGVVTLDAYVVASWPVPGLRILLDGESQLAGPGAFLVKKTADGHYLHTLDPAAAAWNTAKVASGAHVVSFIAGVGGGAVVKSANVTVDQPVEIDASWCKDAACASPHPLMSGAVTPVNVPGALSVTASDDLQSIVSIDVNVNGQTVGHSATESLIVPSFGCLIGQQLVHVIVVNAAGEVTTLELSLDLQGQAAADGQGADEPPSYAPWKTSVLKSAGPVGRHSSVEVGPDGVLHVAYFDDALDGIVHGSRTGAEWSWEVVDQWADSASSQQAISLALDSVGVAHLAYQANTNSFIEPVCGLKYAKRVSGAWQTSCIDVNYTGGFSPSLAVDGNGQPHISYSKYETQAVFYVTGTPDKWTIPWFAQMGKTGTEHTSSIALDAAGEPVIAYSGGGAWGSLDLRVSRRKQGKWIYEVVSEHPGGDPDLVLDSAGHAHIAHREGTLAQYPTDALMYSTDASGSWVTVLVDDAGQTGWFPSMKMDAAGVLHVAYYRWPPGGGGAVDDLRYAINAGGAWTTMTADAGASLGLNPSLEVDALGGVHVTYYDEAAADLKYAYRGCDLTTSK